MPQAVMHPHVMPRHATLLRVMLPHAILLLVTLPHVMGRHKTGLNPLDERGGSMRVSPSFFGPSQEFVGERYRNPSLRSNVDPQILVRSKNNH